VNTVEISRLSTRRPDSSPMSRPIFSTEVRNIDKFPGVGCWVEPCAQEEMIVQRSRGAVNKSLESRNALINIRVWRGPLTLTRR
jgi:hypothetical protein